MLHAAAFSMSNHMRIEADAPSVLAAISFSSMIDWIASFFFSGRFRPLWAFGDLRVLARLHHFRTVAKLFQPVRVLRCRFLRLNVLESDHVTGFGRSDPIDLCVFQRFYLLQRVSDVSVGLLCGQIPRETSGIRFTFLDGWFRADSQAVHLSLPCLFGTTWDFAGFVGWTDNVSTDDCVLLLCSIECLGAVVASAISDSDRDPALLLRCGTWCL